LGHPQWYVVRNACKLLSELKDPKLLQQIEPALHHRDERVQKAAIQALLENKRPGWAAVLADALPCLAPSLLEDVLTELMFEKEALCLPGLLAYLKFPASSS